MIAKKGKGNIVNNLHTINLIEVDSNFNNKVLAKLTIECAERNKLLSIEQFGSRKVYQAIYQTTNKRILYDIA